MARFLIYIPVQIHIHKYNHQNMISRNKHHQRSLSNPFGKCGSIFGNV